MGRGGCLGRMAVLVEVMMLVIPWHNSCFVAASCDYLTCAHALPPPPRRAPTSCRTCWTPPACCWTSWRPSSVRRQMRRRQVARRPPLIPTPTSCGRSSAS